MIFFCLFLSLTLPVITSAADVAFCYAVQSKDPACKGPDDWSKENANCGLSHQSPINIVKKDAKLNSELKSFTFKGYDKEADFTLKNNGHTVELELESGGTIEISGGGLPGTYYAAQLHFHWGNKDKSGSEHSIDEKKYPIELHIVHKKKTTRSESSGGSTTSGNLAVLGFFINVGSANKHYSNLIDGFSKIGTSGTNTTISKVKLEDLIPQDLKVFYRYDGSLTTPPCDETVTWTVFDKPIELSQEQIDVFSTKLKYSDGTDMVENFRPLQKLNERTIEVSGVDAILPCIRYLLISLLVFYLTSGS